MTDVYVDLAAAALDPTDSVPDSESARALRLLAESGMRVILVSGDGSSSPAGAAVIGAPGAERPWDLVATVPARPEAHSWYLTSDVAHCQGATARLRTVLIGAAPPAASVRRCDAVARDVQAAVMEILAAEAMPSKL